MHVYVLLIDVVTSMDFDSSGGYLAVGDHGGRVILFRRNTNVKKAEVSYTLLTLNVFTSVHSLCVIFTISI